MKKEVLFKKLSSSLPIERKTENFFKDIQEVYNQYLFDISELEADAYGGEEIKNTTIQEVKNRIRTILLVLKRYFEGCHSEAYQMLKEQIVKKDGSLDIDILDIKKTDESNTYFYRARKDDGSIHSYKDMFHIPYNLRGIVKTERFSVSGYPSLYLGNTIYDCWEEMGRPSFEELYFSGFRVMEEFKVYDLRNPKIGDFETERLSKTLKRLVYIMACQFKVLHQEHFFKPEYIIPQLILELIVSLDRKKRERDCSPYSLAWGVVYTSTHLTTNRSYYENCMENVVVPAIDNSFNSTYCGFLASLFEISDPVHCRYEELDMCQNKKEIANEYELTEFGFIENRLNQSTKYNAFEYIEFDGSLQYTIPSEGGIMSIKIKSDAKWKLSFVDPDEFELY